MAVVTVSEHRVPNLALGADCAIGHQGTLRRGSMEISAPGLLSKI